MSRSKGQALVLLLGFVAALSAALLLVFDAGQIANQKQRLVDTADAAAFSGAVWQARSLNLQAYLNRAIVANEAAIGQSVSLRSFSGYMGQFLQNASRVTEFAPYIGPASSALAGVWSGFDQVLQPTLSGAEAAFSLIDQDFSLLQQVVHGAGLVTTRDLVARTVAANEPTARISTAGDALIALNAAQWLGLTDTYAGLQRDRQKQVVTDSLDAFTHWRGHTWQSPLLPLVRLEKRGGTELQGFDSWRGLDTLAVHLRSGLLFGRWRERVPIGWGAAEAVRSDTGERGAYGDSVRVNPRTSRLGLASVRSGYGYLGLPGVRDVSRPAQPGERELRIAVEVERDLASIATARIAMAGAHVRLPDGTRLPDAVPPATRMRAIAAARVEFVRPEGRADGLREWPSLFSPYWQARLALPSSRERVLAAALNGHPDPLAVAP